MTQDIIASKGAALRRGSGGFICGPEEPLAVALARPAAPGAGRMLCSAACRGHICHLVLLWLVLQPPASAKQEPLSRQWSADALHLSPHSMPAQGWPQNVGGPFKQQGSTAPGCAPAPEVGSR